MCVGVSQELDSCHTTCSVRGTCTTPPHHSVEHHSIPFHSIPFHSAQTTNRPTRYEKHYYRYAYNIIVSYNTVIHTSRRLKFQFLTTTITPSTLPPRERTEHHTQYTFVPPSTSTSASSSLSCHHGRDLFSPVE